MLVNKRLFGNAEVTILETIYWIHTLTNNVDS